VGQQTPGFRLRERLLLLADSLAMLLWCRGTAQRVWNVGQRAHLGLHCQRWPHFLTDLGLNRITRCCLRNVLMLRAEPSRGPPTQRSRRPLELQSLTRLSLFCWLKIPLPVACCSSSPPSDGSRGESSQVARNTVAAPRSATTRFRWRDLPRFAQIRRNANLLDCASAITM
jgi:hypothetical protein